jgi:DNA-binding NarL/FixJ family response regulator
MPKTISVVLADDHPIVLAGYQHLLEDEGGVHIIAQTGSSDEAISLCAEHEPDILVLDLGGTRVRGK